MRIGSFYSEGSQRLKSFLPAHSTFVVFVLKGIPLTLNGFVVCHFHLRLCPFIAVFLIVRNEVVEKERISTFRAIFWKNANEEEVDAL